MAYKDCPPCCRRHHKEVAIEEEGEFFECIMLQFIRQCVVLRARCHDTLVKWVQCNFLLQPDVSLGLVVQRLARIWC
jgi:hypothetical protein